ncbi:MULTISPECIES: fumarylacetoacetate hydrolase [Pseudomonas]|uniref:Fumarylacetoacetate hydrolase n=3 Tax=Pseudomonas TaxID=286 RepID=A0A0G3GIM5_9PSED|nr:MULTISPECIES: fumarylacetoacetate hydrolase [Pseudomonas]AKK00979.1 fumarylacetoacetate hydrolase [Pseudomonas chlororaphis]KIQ60830.1 fumarylacetoacetate hydrolase [Pseudomonas fluorescens]ROM83803.1 fumarylacetoacetate hydrolase [Pseudomonas brassicacearum]
MTHYVMLLDAPEPQRGLGVFDFKSGQSLEVRPSQGNLYEALTHCAQGNLDWETYLKEQPSTPYPLTSAAVKYRPPLMPDSNLAVQLSEVTLCTAKTEQAWYYKGNGRLLRTDGDPLQVPYHAQSISSEPCIVCLYWVDHFGALRFMGFTLGNDLHDHVLHGRDAISSAQARLRTCAVAPALILGEMQADLAINVQVERDGQPLAASHHRMSLHGWQSLRRYSQAFLEKHEQFLEPGLVHYVFHSLSHRTTQVSLQHGDCLSIDCPELELTLRNQIVEEELAALFPLPARRAPHSPCIDLPLSAPRKS